MNSNLLLRPASRFQVSEQGRPVHRSAPPKHRNADIVPTGLPIVNIGRLLPMKRKRERERTPFGRRMLEAREYAEKTQEDVEAALGISQSTLSGLESENNSSGRTVELAALYGVSATWLATGDGDMLDHTNWPLKGISPTQIAELSSEDRAELRGMVRRFLEEVDGRGKTPPRKPNKP